MKTDQVTLTLLFDEYGALLTEKQRSCFELHYDQDLSLGEIAEELGISRQGVHDTLSRAEAALTELEAALGNAERARRTAEALAEIDDCLTALKTAEDESLRQLAARIEAAAERIKENPNGI